MLLDYYYDIQSFTNLCLKPVQIRVAFGQAFQLAWLLAKWKLTWMRLQHTQDRCGGTQRQDSAGNQAAIHIIKIRPREAVSHAHLFVDCRSADLNSVGLRTYLAISCEVPRFKTTGSECVCIKHVSHDELYTPCRLI